MAVGDNEIRVLVNFDANAGNLAQTIKNVQTQLNALAQTNTKLGQVTGRALPGFDQQVSMLSALGVAGDKTAASLAKLAQSQKTFYSVYSGNVKQNLASLFRNHLTAQQSTRMLAEEFKNVQVVGARSYGTLSSLADHTSLRMRMMAGVGVERLARFSTAMVNAGKNAQWTGRQLIVGLTAPIAAMTYVLGKAATEVSRAETNLAKFMLELGGSAEEAEAKVATLTPKLEELSIQLGINRVEVTNMAAAWAAAGFTNPQSLFQITKLTEELAALAQGDIDVAQAQELVRNIMSGYNLTIKETRTELEKLQLIQSTTALQMADIVEALPVVSSVGRSLGMDPSDIAALLAGMRELGVAAPEAAHALKFGLARLAAPTEDAAELYKSIIGRDLGTLLFDKSGSARGVQSIKVLADEFENLTDKQEILLASALFGNRQYDRFLKLMDAVRKPSSDFATALEAQTEEEKAAAYWQEQLNLVMNSLAKQWEKFKVEITSIAANLGKDLLPMLEDGVEGFINFLHVIEDMPQPLKETAVRIAGIAAAMGPLIFALAQVTKLLPGSLLGFGTSLGRRIFGLETAEAPDILQRLGRGPGLVGNIAAGVPTLGTSLYNRGDQELALRTWAQTIMGPTGDAYPDRTLFARMLASRQLGGMGSGLDLTPESSLSSNLLKRLIVGGGVSSTEAFNVADILGIRADLSTEQVGQIRSDILESIERAGPLFRDKDDNIIGGFLPGDTKYHPGGAIEGYISGQLAQRQLSVQKSTQIDTLKKAFGIDVVDDAAASAAAEAVDSFDRSTKAKVGDVGHLNWLDYILDRKTALKTAATTGGEIAEEVAEGAAKKQSTMSKIFDVLKGTHSRERVAFLTAADGGFTTILAKFSSILPKLIGLIGLAVIAFQNWEDIWTGMKGPITDAANLMRESLDSIVGGISDFLSGSEGTENASQAWQEIGYTIGNTVKILAEVFNQLSDLIGAIIGLLGGTFISALQQLLGVFQLLMGNVSGALGIWSQAYERFGAVAGILGTITAAVLGLILALRAFSFVQGLLLTIQQAFLAWQGSILTVSVAMRGLTASLGIIGLIAAAVGIAITVFGKFNDEQKRLAQAAEETADAMKNLSEQTRDFLSVARDGTIKELRTGAASMAGSLVNAAREIHDITVSNRVWSGMSEEIENTIGAMAPVLDEINSLGERRVDILRQQLKLQIKSLEVDELLAKGYFDAGLEKLQEGLSNIEFGNLTDELKSLSTEDLRKVLGSHYDEGVLFEVLFGKNAERTDEKLLAVDTLLMLIRSHADELGMDKFQDSLGDVQFQLGVARELMNETFSPRGTELSSLQSRVDELKGSLRGMQRQAKSTGQEMKDAFGDALENQLSQLTDRVVESVMSSFDASVEAQLSAFDRMVETRLSQFDKMAERRVGSIDKQIDKINELNEKEEQLQRDREYRAERNRLLMERELNMAIAHNEKLKAMHEGRFDDARLIMLNAMNDQGEINKQIRDLDKNHQQELEQQEREAEIERLEKRKERLEKRLERDREAMERQFDRQREAMEKSFDRQRELLQNQLEEATEFSARNRKEWRQMYDEIINIAGNAGVKLGPILEEFGRKFGMDIRKAIADARNDARTEAARTAEDLGDTVSKNFAKGISDSEALAIYQKIQNKINELESMINNKLRNTAAPGKGSTYTDIINSKQYKQRVEEINDLFGKVGKSFHIGGMVPGGKKADVPAVLQEGEFVVRREAAQKLPKDYLESLNKYHAGGFVREGYRTLGGVGTLAMGGAGSEVMGMLGRTAGKSMATLMSAMAQQNFKIFQRNLEAKAAAETRGGGFLSGSYRGLTLGKPPSSAWMGGTPATDIFTSALFGSLPGNWNFWGIARSPNASNAVLPGGSFSQHVYKNAIDINSSAANMQRLWEWGLKFAGPLNIQNLIYNRRIWSRGGSIRGYTGASPHTDHVHTDFNPPYAGAYPGHPTGPEPDIGDFKEREGHGRGGRGPSLTKGDYPNALFGRTQRSQQLAQDYGRAMNRRKFGGGWPALRKLWSHESGWRWWADNPTSSAYGIPQALPGSKMATAGGDWRTNPITQIEWGLKYIKQRYGNPEGAWRHFRSHNWYHEGGLVPKGHAGGTFTGHSFRNMRFEQPAMLEVGETVLNKRMMKALATGGAGSGVVDIDINFNGPTIMDEKQRRELWIMLEEAGRKISRERGDSGTRINIRPNVR